ncbi:DUF1648 domain-containing protein [Halorarius halobius]|uniref:DUF1648 domain-containing protein n=1 Tax=Halorarius halobius TaxID=2962671 RepID=UPI0020CF82DB|nr:DUF1648 domain-containing protein [Halorarius halobius]
MHLRSSDLAAYALLGGSALLGLALWPSLPERMAIHFGPSGNADNVVAKPLAIVLAPGVGVGSVLVTRYGPDWLTRNTSGPWMESLSVVFLAGVIAYVQVFLYAWNLGFDVSPSLAIAPVVVAACALVAYSFTRA